MRYNVNTYTGYDHTYGERKILTPKETLAAIIDQDLEYGACVGMVPCNDPEYQAYNQTQPYTDIDTRNPGRGFVGEMTQGGVLLSGSRLTVIAFTMGLRYENCISSDDVLLADESVDLILPAGVIDGAFDEDTVIRDAAVSIAGIAMPNAGVLQVIQLAPEATPNALSHYTRDAIPL